MPRGENEGFSTSGGEPIRGMAAHRASASAAARDLDKPSGAQPSTERHLLLHRIAMLAALGLALAAPTVASANPHGLGHMALAGTDYATASGDIPQGHQITGLWLQVNSRIRHGNSFTIDTSTVVNFDYIVTCTSPSGNISQRSGSGSASEMLKPSDLFRYHNRYSIPGPFKGAA